jgi:hypothetical protein
VRDEGLINSTIRSAPLPGTVKTSCSRKEGDHGSVYKVELLILFARFESAHWDNNADGGIRPPTSNTTMEALLSNANHGQQHGGRMEAFAMGLDDVTAGLRGLTHKESMEKRQPHVADRVRIFVKSVIFRRI